MYSIVVGGGKVGFYLTKTLLADGHEVLLIELDPKKSDASSERLGAIVLNGDGAEASVQAQAGAARADVVVAVTGEDEDNLVICQMAKQKFHVNRTIARVNNPKNEELFKLLGIDVTVSQTNHIQNLIGQSIPERSFVHLLNLRHKDLAIIEATITEHSDVVHKAVEDINLPVACAIAAIVRGADLIVPDPSTVLEPGDEMIAVTHVQEEDELRRLLGLE